MASNREWRGYDVEGGPGYYKEIPYKGSLKALGKERYRRDQKTPILH